MSIVICLLMITSITAPFTINIGQPQMPVKSGPGPTSGGSGGLADSPWPMFRQNLNHNGVSPYDTSGNPGKLKWTFTTGGRLDLSSPIIGPDETIYIGSQDRKLYAINEDGTQKWNFTTNGSIDGAAAIGSDGTIYIGSFDNKLYAINPDGTEKWNFTTEGQIHTSSPAIGSDGTIYIGCYDDSKLYAINSDGTLRWTYTTGGGIRSTPAISHDGTIYIGSRDRKLHAINPDGTRKWSYTTPGGVLSSPAIGSDGTIYVGSYDTDPTFHAINPDGTKKWSFIAGSSVFSSPAIGSDGVIYFGTHLYIYALYPDGNQKWKLSTIATVHSSPAIGSDGTIYVGAHRNVLAINPDGTEKWNFATGDTTILSSPAIGSDGTIYIGCVDKNLYAIGTPPSLNINVTSHFSELNSAAQSSISVHVIDGTNPVQGATVNLASDNGGIFSPQSGITDSNGDFNSIFNAPTVTIQTDCRINVEASKTGFNDGSGYVDVTINPIPWPMFRQNLNHTGQSPYDTSANTGKLKWKFPTGAYIYSPPSIGLDGTIYVGSYDNNLYAINPDGTEKWNFITGDGIGSSPTIDSDGTIYVSSYDNNLYAINPDGIEKWSFNIIGALRSSPAIGSDGTIYMGSEDTNLYAINSDGTVKWSYPTGEGVQSSPAIGYDGTIYIGSLDHKLYAINPDGTEKWSFITGDKVWSSPAISADETVYVGSYDDNLYAINPDGSEKWSFTSNDDIFSSPAIGLDGTIYVGSNDGKLYAINPDGTQKWNLTIGPWVISSPAIGSDGTIYVGSGENNLYAINPDGTEKWRYATGNGIISSPAIDSDGTIYIGSRDYYLHAIGEGGTPPIADAGLDQTVNEGDIVLLDGSNSVGGSQSSNPDAIALWHMNEGSGNIIYDRTVNDNDGTIDGAVWTTNGKFGNALSFDGVDDYVDVGPNNIYGDGSAITVEAWFKVNKLDSPEICILGSGSRWWAPNSGGFHFLVRDNGRLDFYLYFDSSWRNAVSQPSDIQIGKWYQMVGVYDGSIKLYLNGILKESYPWPGGFGQSTSRVLLGGVPNTINFDGTIDEVVIWDRALSDQEILDCYNSGKEHFTSGESPIISYEWDFDASDGLWWETGAPPDATGPTPTHIYGDDGVYTITLRVTDDAGGTDTDVCIVTVNNVAPMITLLRTYPDDEGSRVTFEAEAIDPGSDDVTYSWELEYGPTIEDTFYNDWVGPEPIYDPAVNEIKTPLGNYPFQTSDVGTHVYGDNYDYTITLTVTDDDGGVSTATTTVTVDNLAPSFIEMNIPSQIDEGSSTLFEVLASDEGSDDLTFTWDFELGPTITNTHLNDGVGFDPYPSPWGDYPFDVWDGVNQAYGDNGVYMLSLSIEDDDGGITTYSTDLNVQNVAPMINMVTAPGGDEGAVLTFTSTATDPGSDDLTFTWSWGDGTLDTMNIHYNDGVGPDPPRSPLGAYPFTTTDTVSHIYGDDGDYTVTLTVEDDDGGLVTYTTTVTIDNVAPTIEPFGPFTVDEGSSFELTTTSTDPGSDDFTFTWDFEMGPTLTNVYYNDGVATDPYPSPWGTYPYSASDSVSHTYGDDGIFPVTLTVTDDDGGATSFMTNITVNNVVPTIVDIGAYMYVNLTLRVAGEKYHSVGIELYEDGVEIWAAEVTRYPGSPDEQSATITGLKIDMTKTYSAIVDYLPNDPRNNGNVWGSNPVWIDITFENGSVMRLHHNFNVRQSDWDTDHWNHIDPWEIEINPNLVGYTFMITSYITDSGSDDIHLTYTYGSQIVNVTYLNNPPNPDPYPSPEVNPRDILDTTMLVYEGSGTVTLVVKDDDNFRLGIGEGTDYLSVG